MEVSELDVRVQQKYMFTNFLFILTWLMFMQGCSSPEEPEPHYFKSFPHIKTNQYQWDYGQGGIYWVSDTAVVLDAVVENKKGEPERGLYQVNTVDGSYELLVTVDINEQYSYCFSEKTLYVRASRSIPISSQPDGYEIQVQTDFEENRENAVYSPIRCKSVVVPSDGAYLVLREGDGALKIDRLTGGTEKRIAHVDHNWHELKRLDVDVSQIAIPIFIYHLDAYVSYRVFPLRQDCFFLSILFRNTWSIKIKNVCLGEWYNKGSNILLMTKAGVFVENHGLKSAASFLITNKQELKIDAAIRGSAISPEGCELAYGAGLPAYGKSRFSQSLQVLDVCKLIQYSKAY
jgi:hypothetical protein